VALTGSWDPYSMYDAGPVEVLVTLRPGTRIGPHEILGPLGRGGMGEVYRARDTKLRRDVAIKVLPASFAGDAERLRRFEREAQLLASLNHSHIAAIYGIEEADGVLGLVLELVSGVTLAEKLSRGPISLEDAILIATHLASALEAAHERGIIHRDLKPSNIMVTPDGHTKVLDFGLARSSVDLDPSNASTGLGLTRDGEILGTFAYMSPEQARGKHLDKRTDVWAFGCVVYEMLAGHQAFGGLTLADTIDAILHQEPLWEDLPRNTPTSIQRLLRRCLQKDVRRRLRDIGDARLEIDDEFDAAVATAISGSAASVVRPEVHLRRLTDFVGLKESPSISPDGKMVAFVSPVAGRKHVWIRLLAGGASIQVTRDPIDHEEPRWSPDSSGILYYSPSETLGEPGTLWEVSAFGGPPRRLVKSIGGGDISHDGRQVALFRLAGDHIELVVVGRDGSQLATVVTALSRDRHYSQPRWSPDDRWIAYQDDSALAFDARLFVVSAHGGGTPKEVAHGPGLQGLSWRPDGAGLVHGSPQGSTMLYPPVFNLRSVAADGTSDVQLTFGDISYVQPDVQRSGRLVATRIRSHSDLWRFPIAGSPHENTSGAERITRQTGQVQTPSVSPSGRQIVYLSDNGGHSNLWVVEADGSGARQITFEEDPAVAIGVPMWSPSGDQILYLVSRGHRVDLWLIEPDGSGNRQVITEGWGACWSNDSQWIYYTPTNRPLSIEKMRLDGHGSLTVRTDGGAPAIGEGALYYTKPIRNELGAWSDLEVCEARPEDGPSNVMARIGWARIPPRRYFGPVLSPDGKWLAAPLLDGPTTNLWLIQTADGSMRPVTDFGDRSVLIARRVAWSSDSRFLYAAVADIEDDVVLFDGLLNPSAVQ
jgi:Tol biopolymer transport system component